MKYEPLIRPEDKPAIELNKAMMDQYRPEMRKYYYDPSRYKTYLEQLGIAYPTVRVAVRSDSGFQDSSGRTSGRRPL